MENAPETLPNSILDRATSGAERGCELNLENLKANGQFVVESG